MVTFNDVMAAGLMASLHEQGLSVPDDISVVGFDDILLARYLSPRLTTMHNPIDKMSTYAAKLALNLSKDGYSQPNLHQFEASLISRQTVKAIQKIG